MRQGVVRKIDVKKATWSNRLKGVKLAPSTIICDAIQKDSTIPMSHKNVLIGGAIQMGMVLDIPYHFHHAEIAPAQVRRRCLVTGIVIGKNDQPFGIIFSEERERDYFNDRNIFDFDEKRLNLPCRTPQEAAIDTGSRSFVRLNDTFFHHVSVLGMVDDDALKKFSRYVRCGLAQSVRPLRGRHHLNADISVYDIADIVPPLRPVIQPGIVLACYFPHLPEKSPGQKLRPTIVCSTVVDRETGGGVALDIIPCTSHVDRMYPHDSLLQQNDFAKGGEYFIKPSRVASDHRHIVPLTSDYFGQEFIMYGSLKNDVFEHIINRANDVDYQNSHVRQLQGEVSLNPNWWARRNPIHAPIMPPTCRIK